MLIKETPHVGALSGASRPEDTNAAARAGAAAPVKEGSQLNPGEDRRTTSPGAEGLSEPQAPEQIYNPFVAWLADAPAEPEAEPRLSVIPAEEPTASDSWAAQVLRRVGRNAAIREGLVEATPFDRPGPVYVNLDYLPAAYGEPEAHPDPASSDWRELVRVYDCGRDYNTTFLRSVRALSHVDFERLAQEIDSQDREVPF